MKEKTYFKNRPAVSTLQSYSYDDVCRQSVLNKVPADKREKIVKKLRRYNSG